MQQNAYEPQKQIARSLDDLGVNVPALDAAVRGGMEEDLRRFRE